MNIKSFVNFAQVLIRIYGLYNCPATWETFITYSIKSKIRILQMERTAFKIGKFTTGK